MCGVYCVWCLYSGVNVRVREARIAFGGAVVSLNLTALSEFDGEILDFVMGTQEILRETLGIWVELSRFLKFQESMIPVYHDIIPVVQPLGFRLIAVANELQALNPVTLIPAIIEFATVTTAFLGAFDVLLPVSVAFLFELERALMGIQKPLPGYMEYVAKVKRFLAYAPYIFPGDRVFLKTSSSFIDSAFPLLRDFEAYIPAYLEASPSIRALMASLFDFGADVSGSMNASLSRIQNFAPKAVDFYDDPDAFIPIVASNIINLLRRSGLPGRLPMIRHHFEQSVKLIHPTRILLDNISRDFPRLNEDMAKLILVFPRQSKLGRIISDLLLHSTIPGNVFNRDLLPTLRRLCVMLDPIMRALEAPMINSKVIVPAMGSLVNTMVDVLPRLTVVSVSSAPLLRIYHKLLTTLTPLLDPLETMISAFTKLNQMDSFRAIIHEFPKFSTLFVRTE